MNTLNCTLLKTTLMAALLMAISCKENDFETFSRSDFHKTTQLTSQTINLHAKEAVHPTQYMVIGDSLVLEEVRRPEKFFVNIYSLNSKELISHIAPKGKGPNEFLRCDFLYKNNAGSFYILDMVLNRISEYNIDSLMAHTKGYIPYHYMASRYASDYCELNDSLFLCGNEFYINDKKYFNEGAQPLYTIQKTNFYEQSQEEAFIYKYFTSAVAGSYVYSFPNQENILVTYKCKDIIEIYNKQLKLKKRLKGPDMLEPEYSLVNMEVPTVLFKDNKKWGSYYSGFSTKDAIYLVYDGTNGVPHKEYTYTPSEIFKISWSGELLQRYILDVFVYNISVDESSKRIYASALRTKESLPELVSFKIK